MQDVLARSICPSQNDSLQTPPLFKEIHANNDHNGSKLISKVGQVGQAQLSEKMSHFFPQKGLGSCFSQWLYRSPKAECGDEVPATYPLLSSPPDARRSHRSCVHCSFHTAVAMAPGWGSLRSENKTVKSVRRKPGREDSHVSSSQRRKFTLQILVRLTLENENLVQV